MKRRSTTAIKPIRRTVLTGRSAGLILGLLATLVCVGCGYSQGQLLYMMGFGAGRKADAEFELTREGPVVVLVDDFEGQIEAPRTRLLLAELLGKELVAQEAIADLVPPARVQKLRQRRGDFEELSTREIGELVGAHQVVSVQIREFYAPTEVEDTGSAARLAAAVKVLNALEKEDRTKVRLWPAQRSGKIASVELNANEAVRAKTPEARGKVLAAKMAVQIAKYFYEYPLDDFE